MNDQRVAANFPIANAEIDKHNKSNLFLIEEVTTCISLMGFKIVKSIMSLRD